MRILITGAGGFLGGALCRECRAAGHHVTALVHARPAPEGVEALRLDLLDPDLGHALDAVLTSGHFAAVIHAAALANPNQCEAEPELSRRLGVSATAALARACARRGVPLAFTSSDLVFDGARGRYAEDEPVSPLGVYARHKAETERALLELHPQGGLVCRMPLMYGRTPGAACFLDGFLAQAGRGDPLRLFEDEFRSPLWAVDGARGILLALGAGARGVLHLGGPERLSRLEFGRALARAMVQAGLPAPGLIATRQAEVSMAAPRPPDVSLDSGRARALGFAPLTVAQALPLVLAEHDHE